MSLPKTANRALSPTRGDRLLDLFRGLAVSIRDLGLSRQLIEDGEFHSDSIVIGGRKLANFGLCSYLGLGDDERVRQGAHRAIDKYGASYSSSIAYTAVPLYGDLRERFGEIFGASVVIAGTTTLAHLAALPVIVRPGDHVLIDSQVHASVMTGSQVIQAAGNSIENVPHNDVAKLELAIQKAADDSKRVWLLTDGVYSMNGDTSPAEEHRRLLDRFPNLHIYCDDAHGFGWDGERGSGQYLRRAGWHERLVIVVGLAKAFGSLGGVIATTNEELAETVELCGPALTFGGPIPPPSLGAAVACADIFLSDELAPRQAALMERIRLVNRLGADIGLRFSSEEETPLWFYDVGEVQDMKRLLVAMSQAGFYLNAAGFPVVPHGHAGLRFTVTIDNSLDQIESMLTAMNEARLEILGETEFEIDLNEARTPNEEQST